MDICCSLFRNGCRSTAFLRQRSHSTLRVNFRFFSSTKTSKAKTNVLRAIVNQRYTCPSSFSSELTDLIKKILVIDVTTRLGCMANGNKDIQNHPFFDTVNFVKIYQQTENPSNIPCESKTLLEKWIFYEEFRQTSEKRSVGIIEFESNRRTDSSVST